MIAPALGCHPSSDRSRVVSSLPDAVVGPLAQVFVGLALQVEARHAQRPHAEEREAALVEAVDQLRARRRGLREDAEPRKRIHALVEAQDRRGNGRTADAVKPVAAGDEVAGDRVVVAVVPIADATDAWSRCRATLTSAASNSQRPAAALARRDRDP